MRIRWTLAAAEDLEHIKNYLTELPHSLRSRPYLSFTKPFDP
jgi:plasmid stabilization system protein ParE